jgi:hypothetical protein
VGIAISTLPFSRRMTKRHFGVDFVAKHTIHHVGAYTAFSNWLCPIDIGFASSKRAINSMTTVTCLPAIAACNQALCTKSELLPVR